MGALRLLFLFSVFQLATLARGPGILVRVNSHDHASQSRVFYFLVGTFGGVGGTATATPDQDTVLVPTEYNGVAGKRLKAVVYAPGCQMHLLTLEDVDSHSKRMDLGCQPLPTIPLYGAIPASNALPNSDLSVEVQYVGYWANLFLGIMDGPVPVIPLGNVVPSKEGLFKIEVPDFSADPTFLPPLKMGV